MSIKTLIQLKGKHLLLYFSSNNFIKLRYSVYLVTRSCLKDEYRIYI